MLGSAPSTGGDQAGTLASKTYCALSHASPHLSTRGEAPLVSSPLTGETVAVQRGSELLGPSSQLFTSRVEGGRLRLSA